MPRQRATLRLRPTDVGIGPLFQHIRDAAIVADLDTGMIRLWNPAAERLFGYTTSEALLLPVDVLVPERLRQRHSAGFVTYRATGHGALIDAGTPFEVPARRKTGEEITVELSLSPVEDPRIDGRYVLAIIRDVGERARARQHAAVAQLGHSALAANDVVTLMDETVGVVARTLAVPYCGILELVPGDGGLLLRAAVGWRDGQVGRATVSAETGSIGGYTLASDVPVILDDLATETRFDPSQLLGDHGVVSGMSCIIQIRERAFGVLTADTDLPRAFTRDEAHFLQAVADMLGTAIERKRADEASARLAAIVQSSEDAVIGKDLDGVITSWNAGAQRLYGYTAEEIVGRPIRLLFPPDRADELPRIMARLARGGRIEHYETVRLRKDGRRIDVSISVSPVRASADRIVGAAAIARDITDRKRSEEERQRLFLEQVARNDAERAEQRAAFLAEASRQLAGSLDYAATLRGVARLAVPKLADCCAVVHVDEEGRTPAFDVASTLPGREEFLSELLKRYPPVPDVASPASNVLLTRTATLVPDVSDEWAEEFAQDAEQLRLFRALGARSLLIVPLLARSRMVGVLLCVSIESGRRYTRTDLALAEDLAAHCALAVDNARLYEAAERARSAAEESASRLTHLQRVTAALSEAVTVEQVAEVVVHESVAALAAPAAVLVMQTAEGDALELVRSVGLSETMLDAYRRIPLDASTPAAEVVRTRRPLWITSLTTAAARFPYFAESSTGYRAFAVLPLALEDDTTGALTLAFAEERSFESEDRAFLAAVAAQCATALQRAAAFARERTSRERLELALEAGHMGIWNWDSRTGRISWSKQLEAIHGLEPGTFGGTFDEYPADAHPEDAARVRDEIRASIESGEHHLEYRIVRPDSSVRWVEERGRVVRDAAGQAVGMRGLCMDITPRKAAEQALRESEERFHTLADNIAQFAWMAHAGGWIFWYNRRWYEYTGTTLDEMQGWGWTKVHHPDHVERVIAGIRSSWESGEPWEDTFPLRGRDGQYRWFLSRALPIRDDRGNIVRWFGTNTDVTEQREAEQEREHLYAAERHARLGAEATSAQLAAIQTVTETALAHLTLEDLLHELLARISTTLRVDTATVFLADESGEYLLSRAARGLGAASERDIRIPLGAGFAGRVAAERRAIPVEDIETVDILDPRLRERQVRSALGAPLVIEGRVIGVLQLGTVRRHRFAEDEMHLLQLVADRMALVIEHVRLYEAEQRARREAESLAVGRDAILRQIADAVVIADPSGAVVFANDVAKRLLGLPEPGIPLTLRTGGYQVLTKDGQPYAPEELPLARAARQGDLIVDAELRIQHPDGSERVAQGSAVPVVAEDGNRYGAVLTLHDVTAQRQLERQKEEFFANASHDLRTPITTIKASIDVVLENELPGTPEPLHRLLANINREADRMTTLVNDLLELTRLQTGHVQLDLAPHDLRVVAAHAVSAIEPLAHGRGQRVELVLPKKPVVAQSDPGHLERALLNLLANAQRYGREGGLIRLRLRRRATEAVFSVEDDGPGIPEADQARLFERFYRPANEATRRDQGSGLGLPIARAMAELHGGRIWVESVLGRGAAFHMALPLAEPVPAGRTRETRREDPHRR